MSELLEQAQLAADDARETLNAVTEGDVVTALVGCALELRAFRLTVQAVAGQQAEPRGAELPDVEEGWYVIELMGHRRSHGYVRAVRLAGRQLVEIVSPVALVDADGEPTGEWGERVHRYAAAAIFSLSESSEEDAREEVENGFPF